MGKIALPIKTKIAAWWMMVIGGVPFLPLIVFLWPESFSYTFPGILFSAPVGLFFIIVGCFLLKRKGISWWSAIILLLITLIISILTLVSRYKLHRVAAIEFLYIWGVYLLIIPSPLGAPFFFLFRAYPQLWSIGRFFLILLPFIPFMLLLSDRKNFWKIAS